MNDSISVVLAILYREGKFLMQLRDDIAGILYPGHWGLFGGHIEPGETPEEGLYRELMEEINYDIQSHSYFHCYTDPSVIRHVYHAPLNVSIENLKLNEGWDLALLTPEEIERGYCYSSKAGEKRPIGDIHQLILLDFWQTKLQQISIS